MVVKTITVKHKRVDVEGDDGKTLTLHLEAYIESSLCEGQTLRSSDQTKLIERSRFFEASERALKALAYKPYSATAMHKKLEPVYGVKITEAVLKMLKEHRYIDDQKILTARLEDALMVESKGPYHYKQAWYRHDFPLPLIEEILASVPEDTWVERCLNTFHDALKRHTDVPHKRLKEQLTQTALRQGFNIEHIQAAWPNVVLPDIDEDALIQAEIERYKTHYNLNEPKEKQAFIRKLLAKGYPYDRIKNHVN